MATGQSIVEDALLDIGVGSPGEAVEQSLLNHGLRVLNRMWSSWSAEIAPIYSSTFESLTWTADSQSMTIGSGGDLDTARPIEITGIQTRKDTLDYTLNQITLEQYQTTVLKTVSTDYPEVYAYQKDYTLGRIYIYPVPSSNIDIRITSKKALTAFTMSGTISLPDGYELAVQKNLTILLAPAYGKSVRSEVIEQAFKAKAAIMSVNSNDGEIWPDYLLPGFDTQENIDILTNG